MKQTNMSAAQITIWFTNARVKMRKEKKLSIKSQDKKKKQKSIDPFDELFSIIDDLFPCTTPPSKQFVIAYSCLNGEQAVCRHIESFSDDHRFHSRRVFMIWHHCFRIRSASLNALMNTPHI